MHGRQSALRTALAFALALATMWGMGPAQAFAEESDGAAVGVEVVDTSDPAAAETPDEATEVGVADASDPTTEVAVDQDDAEASDLQVQAADVASGEWGNCTWRIDGDGRLTISPKPGTDGKLGEPERFINNDNSDKYFPWDQYAGSVTSVAFTERGVLPKRCDCMFQNFSKLTSVDGIKNWDASQVEVLGTMFYGCSSLTSLDVSGWNTSKVLSIGHMFTDCSSLATISGIENWDVSRVFDMGGLFCGCSSLTSLDLSKWNTSKLNWVYSIFDGCSSLTSLDLSGWNTTYADRESSTLLFRGCSSLASIKLGANYNFRTEYMFPDGTWWSAADRTWYTKDQIVSSRSNIADTYTRYEPARAANGMSVTCRTGEVLVSKVQKKAQRTKSLVSVEGAQGAVTIQKIGGSNKLAVDASGRVTVKKKTKKGTYKVTVRVTAAGDADHAPATQDVTVVVKVLPKLSNPMSLTAKTPTVRAGKSVSAKKLVSVKGAKGKVTYKKAGGNKKIVVAKNGKLTVKKGLKPGTYRVKLKVTAAGNGTYKKATKTVVCTVIVP